MELFIGNLPANTSLGQLIAFFKGFSSKIRFQLNRKSLDDGRVACYAVAELDNERYGLKFIQRYAGAMFCGQPLEVREYVHRSYGNERRAVNWREKPWRAGERRCHDRRLKELPPKKEKVDEFESMVEQAREREKKEMAERVETLRIQAYDNFARKS